MLNVRPTICPDCQTIDAMIARIDCALTGYATVAINNNRYELGICLPVDQIERLARYKAILINRRFNPQYAWKVPTSDIISRVSTLLN